MDEWAEGLGLELPCKCHVLFLNVTQKKRTAVIHTRDRFSKYLIMPFKCMLNGVGNLKGHRVFVHAEFDNYFSRAKKTAN